MISEAMAQEQLAYYIRRNYPSVIFHSDFGSGVKMTPGQAKKQSRQNGGRRAWPDMTIAKVKRVNGTILSAGLYIELKREDVRLKKKDGSWANAHIEEQAAVLEQLRSEGYDARFAIGLDDAKKIVDEYLGGV